MNLRPSLAALVLALSLLAPGAAAAASDPAGSGDSPTRQPHPEPPRWFDPHDRRDPLVPLLRRISDYFHANEVNGVTLDARVTVNRTEAIRLSVISQLLGYAELYRVLPIETIRLDITERADYLVLNLTDVLSGGPFDGMAGLSLLAAFEATGDSSYLAEGRLVVNQLMALPTYDTILNGGLMAAMAMADYARLTGDAATLARAHDIVAGEVPYQREDGSFPHWCDCTRDVHYTGWMAMELILIQRMMADPNITPMLQKMHAFLEARVDSVGDTRYQESCPDYPGCLIHYSSLLSGCSIDTETRGFTNEWGYSALLFDHFGSLSYRKVMNFMIAHEARGTFADKWDYFAPLDDPYYVWSSADTSVVNMSVMFWSFTSLLSGRPDAAAAIGAWGPENAPAPAPGGSPAWFAAAAVGAPADAAGRARGRSAAMDALLPAGFEISNVCDQPTPAAIPGGEPERGWRLGPILPNPARAPCEIRFALPEPGAVSLAIYDAGGRRVLEIFAGQLGAGEQRASWDRRSASGARVPAGLYFVRLDAGGRFRAGRMLVVP